MTRTDGLEAIRLAGAFEAGNRISAQNREAMLGGKLRPTSLEFDGAVARLTEAGSGVTAIPSGIEVADPWGTRLRITRG